MAHARTHQFPRRSGGNRRHVAWSAGPRGATGSLTASGRSLFPVGTTAGEDDLTLIRTRGELQVSLLAASAAGEGIQWALGLCNVTQNAFGIGVTAVPDPIEDAGWDGWFVHEEGVLFARDATPLDDPATLIHRTIDSKAMRKTHRTDTLIAVFGLAESGAVTVRADLITRILDKLP